MIRRVGSVAGLLLVVVLCVGCARARVKNVQEFRAQPVPRPARIVVFDFYTGGTDVRLGTGPRRSVRRAVRPQVDEADLVAEAVADTLANRLVADIRALGLPAERATGTTLPGTNDLVIQGQFMRVDEGSQTQRFVIGFGLGATEVRTEVEIFQVTAEGWRPVKQFDAVATGARLPGAGWFVAGGAVGGTVAASAMMSSGVGVLRELRASIDADAGRIAEQIARKVSELAAAHRW
jgi:hypothetical protein